jgi:hypothetical protein
MHKLYQVSRFAKWKQSVRPALHGFRDRFDLYKQWIESQPDHNFLFLEFGVSKGVSIRWWTQHLHHPDARFVGFDTFEGIPEDWGTRKKGSYTNEGKVPEVKDPRCTFQKGLFQHSLPGFIEQTNLNRRLIVHLDADLYSATLFVLTSLAPHLKPTDIIVFDEFTVTTHEFRAWMDFLEAFPFSSEVVGESGDYTQVMIALT